MQRADRSTDCGSIKEESKDSTDTASQGKSNAAETIKNGGIVMAHISEKMLQAYVSRRLPLKEEQAIMEHIAGCDRCARRFER